MSKNNDTYSNNLDWAHINLPKSFTGQIYWSVLFIVKNFTNQFNWLELFKPGIYMLRIIDLSKIQYNLFIENWI